MKALAPAAIDKLPAQPAGVKGLLTEDDKLLFDLHLYRMAVEIRHNAPWEYLYEHEIFGVQVPGTDRVWFVSVMGSEGEFEALAFYKGFEGLAGFVDFRMVTERISRMDLSPDEMFAATMRNGSTLIIPHLMLSFTDREELGKDDLAAIKKSGKRFRGKGQWPRIEEVVPGYFPS